MPADFVQQFEGEAASLDVVGGKGLSLARMTTAGMAVPPGFIVTTSAYRQSVARESVQSNIIDQVQKSGADAATEVQTLFDGMHIADDIIEQILSAYDALGAPAVAVRSSANAEDLPELSFAGQQDTYLNVSGQEPLLDAVRRCWASLWNARAIDYRGQMGIDHDAVAMAVVVQIMVPSDVSGILFTANPATGDRDEMIINASFGLGEAVVGGYVTADAFVLDRESLTVKQTDIGDKQVQIVSDGAQGTQEIEVSADMRAQASLSPTAIDELARQALSIETAFGGAPIDIEWAIEDGKLWLLQARPITNLPPAPLKNVVWESTEPGDYLMRNQVVEFMPGPLSPLFEELYLPAVDEGFALRRDWIDGTTDGLTRAANYERRGNETVNGYAYRYMGNPRDRKKGGTPPPTPREKTVSIGMVSWVCHEWPRRWRHVKLPCYLEAIERWRQVDVTNAKDHTLLEGICALTQADGHYWEAANGVMALPRWQDQALQDFLKEHAPDAGFTSGMLLDASDSLTMKAQVDLWHIARAIRANASLVQIVEDTPAGGMMSALSAHPGGVEVSAAIINYLGTYGHQIYSLDYVEPTPLQDPTPVLSALKTQVQDAAYDPVTQQREIGTRRRDAIRTITRYFKGKRRWQFRWRLFWAQRFYANRDEAQFFVGAAWPVLQRMALALGNRLVVAGMIERADDVYFLQKAELTDAVAARQEFQRNTHFKQAAADRRQLREARERLVPPERISPETDTTDMEDQNDDLLRGTAVSPGKITAAVSVIHSAADFDQMSPNTILVCPFTTPAWTQLFSHAVGLVTDIGSITSHGSIVAREYGIPAVLGLGDITSRLQNGQVITVDGDAGTVMVDDVGAVVPPTRPARSETAPKVPKFEGLQSPLPFRITRSQILMGKLARPFQAAFYSTIAALVFWLSGPRGLL